MNIARRGRSLAVSGFLLAGAVGVIGSTQTWLTVQRTDAAEPLLVSGASALPLLAPLSLAVLALGAALSIAGRGVRLVFGVLAGATALFLAWSTVQLLASPLGAVGPAVTEATGLAGAAALDEVVGAIEPSAWPSLSLGGWAVLLAAAVLVVLTGRRWRVGGRRYRTDAEHVAHDDGPVDAIDSWDELSRGSDPTR